MSPLVIRLGGLAIIHYFAWPWLRDSVIWRKGEDQPETTWTQTFMQTGLYFALILVFLLYLLYQTQEGMLYVPSTPIHHMKDNPERYRSPAERRMHFEDVNIVASDGTKLHGWLIYHPE